MTKTTHTLADLCIVAAAEAWRGDGEILASGIGVGPRLAAGLAWRTHSPDLMMTDSESVLVSEPVPVGPRNGYQPQVEGWMPFRRVFDILWAGRRHAMTMPTQIDRFGNINISAIGDPAKPKVQLLGARGIPGNTINHPCSFFIPSHTPRTFVERVDMASGVGYDPERWSEGVRRDFMELRLVVSNLAVMDFRGPNNGLRIVSTHPGVTVDQVREQTGFEIHTADQVERDPDPDRRAARHSRAARPARSASGSGIGLMSLAVLETPLSKALGCRYPIIQTAMGWVATPELVAASCNAGAFGFLACATSRPEQAEADIRKVTELTDKPFGVNFLMEQPGAAEIVDSIVRHGARAASYSRSPKREFIDKLKAAGILCVPTVGAARHAEKAVQLGADIIVAQGGEGGGHTGIVPTSLLLPQVIEAVDVPVAAAGGFHSGQGLVAALAYGADGIAMGTRFLLTAESPVPAATAERYFKASVMDVPVTTQVDGLPQRVVRNELVSELESSSAPALLMRALKSALEYRKLSGASIGELVSAAFSMRKSEKLTRSQMMMAANAPILIKRAMVEGVPSEGVLPSGQVTGVIDDQPTCAELVARLMTEAEDALTRLTGSSPATA